MRYLELEIMKSKEEIREIFSIFEEFKQNFSTYMESELWQVIIFKPFVRDGRINYPFRVYGQVSGSKFLDYNAISQLCGGVNYFIEEKSDELTRAEWKNELHPVVILQIDLPKILGEI